MTTGMVKNLALKKVFISHSRADKELVEYLQEQLRQANLQPILYAEQAGGQDMGAAASLDIYKKMKTCKALLVLLGPNVAQRSHTQAWVGFEVGTYFALYANERNQKRLPGEEGYPQPHRIWLLEDVRQEYDAAIPFADYVYLFDFSKEAHWAGLEAVAKVASDTMTMEHADLNKLNKLRRGLLSYPFECPYKSCRARYELHIYTGQMHTDEEPKGFIVKCSVCRKDVRLFWNEQEWLTEEASYRALLHKLEDLEDLVSMKDALLEPSSEGATWEDYKKQRTARVRHQKG